MKVEQAKQVLKQAGYYVDNLWTVSDVKCKFDVDDDKAQDILDGALTNEATIDQIWFAIEITGEEGHGLKKIESC